MQRTTRDPLLFRGSGCVRVRVTALQGGGVSARCRSFDMACLTYIGASVLPANVPVDAYVSLLRPFGTRTLLACGFGQACAALLPSGLDVDVLWVPHQGVPVA